MKCPKCGAESEGKFCSECGSRLGQTRQGQPRVAKAVYLILGLIFLAMLVWTVVDTVRKPQSGTGSRNEGVVARWPIYQKETPREIAQRFAQSVMSGDFATAEGCLTERCRNQRHGWGLSTTQLLQSFQEDCRDFIILGDKISGETASVKIHWIGRRNPGQDIWADIILYKVDGDWKIESFYQVE